MSNSPASLRSLRIDEHSSIEEKDSFAERNSFGDNDSFGENDTSREKDILGQTSSVKGNPSERKSSIRQGNVVRADYSSREEISLLSSEVVGV